MIMVPPERAVFASHADIIDYVSRGMPPTRKNFDKVIAAIRNPMSDEQVNEATASDVVLSHRLFNNINNDEFAVIVNRVYQNNVYNRNVAIASFVGGVAAGVIITAKICGGGSSTD